MQITGMLMGFNQLDGAGAIHFWPCLCQGGYELGTTRDIYKGKSTVSGTAQVWFGSWWQWKSTLNNCTKISQHFDGSYVFLQIMLAVNAN